MAGKLDDLPDGWSVPLRLGYSVIPLGRGCKRPATGWKQFQTRSPTVDEVRGWAVSGHNVGIVTGTISDIAVLDLDSAEAVAAAEARGLPRTPRVSTPRGQHVYFRRPGAPIRNGVALFNGADLRAEGGYVVAPGSTYLPTPQEASEGKVAGKYEWLVSPLKVPLAPMPDWLLNLVIDTNGHSSPHTEQPSGASERANSAGIIEQLAKVRGAAVGTRNVTLNRAAFILAKTWAGSEILDQDVVQAELTRAALDAGLRPAEIGPTLRSGWAAGLSDAEIDPTEDGVALHFSRSVGSDFIYDHRVGSWYHWLEGKWARVPRDHLIAEFRSIARAASKPGLRKASAATGAELLARSDPGHRLVREWNHDPFLLGTPTGIVDLRTGLLREAKRADAITKETSVGPGTGTATRWTQFLRQATGDDPSLIDFLQRLCGYALTGDIREQCLFFVYGQGGNGKSVFLNTVRAILHDYAVVSATDTFAASSFSKHPTDLAMLEGARLVCASETDRGKAWDEVRVKQLTGGDPITARYMRQDFFTFEPTFKLVIVGNHKPELRDVDDALRRRILIVPFTCRPDVPDLMLETKLRAEHEQILSWMILGCQKWLKGGLKPPAAVRSATADYFAEQDGMARWIDDRCDVAGHLKTPPNELFNSWSQYAHEMGYSPMTSRAFGDAILRHGFDRLKTNGVRYFAGVGLKPEKFV